MVKKLKKGEKILFQCEECGFHYRDEKITKECETWCKKYKSCSIEITKQAIENQGLKTNGEN